MVGLAWADLILKIPLVLGILIVWWVIRRESSADPPASDEDGGIRRTGGRRHPIRPFPRPSRRGPHSGAPPPSPRRVRVARAPARTPGH